jgi:hypothetical protein
MIEPITHGVGAQNAVIAGFQEGFALAKKN